MRRFLLALGIVATLLGAAQPAAAAQPQPSKTNPTRITPTGKVVSVPKSASGQLAQSDAGLLKRNDTAMVNIMVKIDADSIASYRGGVQDLAATSPAVTGQPLSADTSAVYAYSGYLLAKSAGVHRAAVAKVPGLQIGTDFTTAFGGFSARVPANQAKKLLDVPGVAAVMYDTVEQTTDMASPTFVGATAVWPTLGGDQRAGQGAKIGVIDTGIWPEHPMLAQNGLPKPQGGPYKCQFGSGATATGPAFSCNNKLLGAYVFLNTNLQVNGSPGPSQFCTSGGTCSARDSEGHGTHTATTAAGDKVNSAVMLGVDRGPTSGIAPGASIIAYRVCLENGCYQSDSIAAIEQAIKDDVDVINFSIGGGANPYADPVELAFLDAYASGIEVNASAGNDGPSGSTAEHGGPWVTSVGASTLNRNFASVLHLTADGGAALDLPGVTITRGVTNPTPVVLASAGTYNDALCGSAPTSNHLWSGKVVVCERGDNARVDKGHNAYLGGAAGFILYNQNAETTDLESDNHWLPAIQVQYANNAVVKFVKNHTHVMATWQSGTAQAAPGDVMASFSSRGPDGEFIKPDVTAPGVQIMAGMTPRPASTDNGPSGELYQAIAGTSMSSPHAAGVALLIKAAHPSWTPGQVRSAMMTSALQSVVKENGSTPANPFDRGSGSIRANRAVSPTVTFDVSAPDFYASANDPFARINLNIPSIDAPHMPGSISVSRTMTNVSGTSQTLSAHTTAPNNASITVSPSTITLAAGASFTFQVTIDGTNLADGQYFGGITFHPAKSGFNDVYLPVAFVRTPGDVTLSNKCGSGGDAGAPNVDKSSVALGATKDCKAVVTNLSPNNAHVELKVTAPDSAGITLKNYQPADKLGNGFILNSTLNPSLPPAVEQLVAGDSEFGGFFDLSSFIDPVAAGFTDESFVNLGLVAPVNYGDRSYDTIGVVSDGYLVLGGADSGDVSYLPQDMPDRAAPNNVLAPFWTDFNPEDGGDFYAATFDDTDPHAPKNCYFLFEWKNYPVWSSTHNGANGKETFEIWMLSSDCSAYFNATNESIAFDYGSITKPGDQTPFNVGAEDALGITGQDLGINTMPDVHGYDLVVGNSTPGGSAKVTYQVTGTRLGKYVITASMTSDVTQGTAKSLVRMNVIRP
jgi:subtilisin family serine protease